MIDVNSTVINIHGFPEDEVDSIRRCLETLYSIREGEQPLNREMGLRMDFLDQQANIAQNMFALEVIEKTGRYEPRVKVEKVEFRNGREGQLIPVVHVKRGDR